MSILSKLKNQEKQPNETFFALEITQESVKSAAWLVENKETQVIKVGSIEEWQEGDEEGFLKAVDVSVSSISESIDLEPKGILFGLPEDWVDKDEIIPERKKILKLVCEKLDLKPLGFVVTLEALIEYFKAQQGTPLNAIMIRLGETELAVFLVQMGKIINSESVGRTEDIIADVKEGLARFSAENLPPRMILFNGLSDFEDIKQELMSFDWQKELSFLHFPKIESLSSGSSIRAVAISGGSEVAKSLGLEIIEPEEKTDKSMVSKDAKIPEKEGPVLQQKEIVEESKQEENKNNAETFGFVKGEDIAKETGPKEEPIRKEPEIRFNFTPEEKESKTPEVKDPPKKPFIIRGILELFLKIKNILRGRLLGRKFKFPLSSLSGAAVVAAGLFIVLTLGAFAFYWYIPKAEIVIYVAPKLLEKELDIKVTTEASKIDVDAGVIPAITQEVELEGELSTAATGEKLVGDKSTGKVTILNKVDSSKKFAKGTVLVGENNLKFELDEDVTVASKSSELVADGEKITYGKAEAQVKAAAIGPEYNLGEGAELSFKEYGNSSFSVKTDSGFSGGTSREIRAVSKEDQTSLLNELTEKLKSEAREKLEAKLDSNSKVFEEGIEAKTLEKKFSNEIDEETEELSLFLKLKLTALGLSKNDLNTLLLHSLSSSLPSGFQIETDNIDIEIQEIITGNGEAQIKLLAKAKLVPKYDVEALKDELVGKYPNLVQGYLSTLPNFVKADMKISPKLPGKLGTLPRRKSKISIKIENAE